LTPFRRPDRAHRWTHPPPGHPPRTGHPPRGPRRAGAGGRYGSHPGPRPSAPPNACAGSPSRRPIWPGPPARAPPSRARVRHCWWPWPDARPRSGTVRERGLSTLAARIEAGPG